MPSINSGIKVLYFADMGLNETQRDEWKWKMKVMEDEAMRMFTKGE